MRRLFTLGRSTSASLDFGRTRRNVRQRKEIRRSYSRRGRFEVLEDRCLLTVAGDYSGNDIVGPEDYGLWSQSFGSTSALYADGNNNGVVDAADYVVWRKNLGSTLPGGTPRIDISVDGLSEAHEVNPGTIVWRNSDFSKQTLAPMQPEAGLPLYLPDYLAPSTVYDSAANMDFTDAAVVIDASMIGGYTVQFTFNSSRIRLWTTTAWTGMTDVGSGRYQIGSDVSLTPNTNLLTFQIEGLTNSTAFATDSILVQAVPNAGGATLSDSAVYTVVETGAGVDGNRDTQIDFDNNHDRQLLFWFNNDQEGYHASDTAVESEQPNITAADNTDNVIGQRRDLEDLAPLRVDVDPLLVQNAFDTAGGGMPDPGQLHVTYRLNLVNPGGATLRLFHSNNDQNDAILHVSDDNTADVQANDPFFRMAAGPSFATQLQLEQISEGLNAFLFEAIGAAYGSTFTATPTLEFETIIRYENNVTTSKKQAIELDLRDIKQLYTRWDVDYGVNGGQPGTDKRPDLSFQHYPTPTTPIHTSQITEIPFLNGVDTIVYVHGWNNSDAGGSDDKSAGSETMFKRLYWQGFRGEFVAFNWPTYVFEFDIFDPFASSYNPSEFQAYRSAQALKNILEDYRGEFPLLQPVHLLAHSMGNVVAGEALRQWAWNPEVEDPLVTTYVAMEAAVSAGAYGNNNTDTVYAFEFGRPITDFYRFWSHGRNGFADPGLGLAFFFQGTNFAWEKAINLYNVQDYALNLWDISNFYKDWYVRWEDWPYDYSFEAGDGENVNNDIFTREPVVGPDVTLTLTLPNGQPGPNAYEIMAFYAVSASLALGTKEVSYFEENFDLEDFDMPGGSDIRANHSFQLNHDAAVTWGFFELLKTELGFGATHGSGSGKSLVLQEASAETTLAADLPSQDVAPVPFIVDLVNSTPRPLHVMQRQANTASRLTAIELLLDNEQKAAWRKNDDDFSITIDDDESYSDIADVLFDSFEELPRRFQLTISQS